jgi:hypothetical protein
LEENHEPDAIVINEVQLLLAEKRTSLATMRTGIAVFALPLSVLGLLVATSKYYEFMETLPLLLPLLLLCAGLTILGVYLVHRAVIKIRRYDRIVNELKKENKDLARFIS